jgi:hypothetical protein
MCSLSQDTEPIIKDDITCWHQYIAAIYIYTYLLSLAEFAIPLMAAIFERRLEKLILFSHNDNYINNYSAVKSTAGNSFLLN